MRLMFELNEVVQVARIGLIESLLAQLGATPRIASVSFICSEMLRLNTPGVLFFYSTGNKLKVSLFSTYQQTTPVAQWEFDRQLEVAA
jgi:hypothetical protein